MDSEALLADHQATDGILEEKNTVKEKRLNGEESKDEENAAIAEAERFHADRVVLQEAVIYCSKMPNSTSEKECRKEEAIKEVDSFSEVVEATNKTIEMIKDNKNGELEVPLETAEVAAASGEVESPPVESNNANSAAGDAEGISEQVVVIPTESSSIASATSDVAIAVETREIEAKLEDQKVPTDSVSVKITDDIEVVADEVEKQVSITLVVDSSSTEIAEESREVEAEAEQQVSSDSRIATSDVEKQVLNESSNAASATSFAEEATEAEAKIEGEKKEAIEVEELEDVNAEKTGEEVETETKEVTLSVLTTEEIRNTEDKSVDDEKEAAIEVQEQAPSDSSTSTLSNGKRLESKLIDDEQEVPADAEQKVQSNESAGVEEAKIDDGKTEVETEVEQQFPSDSTNADDHQEVTIGAEKHAATEASDVTSIVVTADEVGSTEAKIMEDEKEAEIEVQEQVPSGSSTSTPTDRISEETQKLEPKFVDEEEEVQTEVEKQIPIEESTEIGAKVEVEQLFPSDSGGTTSATGITEKSQEIEDELADDYQEVITEAEKQVTSGNSNATLAFVTSAEVGETEAKIEDDEKEAATEVQEQAQIDSATFTSANRIAQETKRAESKLIDDDQEVQEEAKKQISSEESSDVRAKIDDGKTEVEPGVEQQFPSDSGSPTSVAVVAERSGEIEAEFADDNKEVKTEAEKQVATETNDVASAVVTADEVRNTETKIDDDVQGDPTEAQEQVPSVSSTSTSADRIAEETKKLESELIDEDKAVLNDSTSDEFIETKAKIESDEEGAVTEVGEQISTDSSTSANRTDEVKLADDNQEAVVNAEEQALVESSRDIFVVAGVEENKEIDAKFKDNKQEEAAAEFRKQELNLQGNEADAANGNPRVLAKEETENATIDGNLNNSNVTEPNTINLIQEDAGTDHISVVKTAVEISQAEVEVETNRIDSGSFAELPTREEKPNASAESVDKKDNILEDKAFMDSLNDVNTISQVPRSNDQSQTDAKDINIEISQEDKITLVESSKNLDCSTETNDEFEGKKSSEGIEIAEGEKEDILKVGKVILDEDSKHFYAPDITESSNKIEKSEVAKEKYEESETNSTIPDETTKSAGENADASSNLSVENKTSEDKEEKQSKDESVNRDYVEAPKDIDVKEEIATAVSAFVDAENKKESEKTIDESLSPKSPDLVKLEEVLKESAPAKSSPRRSNNIISKVKHQIVRAKKAIMGKSPSSKAMSPKSKEEVK